MCYSGQWWWLAEIADGNLVRNRAFIDALVNWGWPGGTQELGIDWKLLRVTGGSFWGSKADSSVSTDQQIWDQGSTLRDWKKKKKGVCNVPCLLLRWSRCLLCWCSFLRWQEDLRGQRRNCCYVEKTKQQKKKQQGREIPINWRLQVPPRR